MNTLVIFVIVAGIVLFLLRQLEQRRGKSHSVDSELNRWNNVVHQKQKLLKEFHIKPTLLMKSEQALFYELKKQLPVGFYIFPNMRVADILTTNHGEGYYKRRNILLPKHIDFLIANEYFNPILAIELNGASHNSYRQQESDRGKNEVFENAGLPLVTIRVGQTFEQQVAASFEKYLKVTRPVTLGN